MVDGAPEVHQLAGNPDHHLVPDPHGRSAADAAVVAAARLSVQTEHRAADGFIGEVEPTLRDEILDVSVAEREPQVEPDSMLDDNRRKAVAAISDFSHRVSLPAISLPSQPV